VAHDTGTRKHGQQTEGTYIKSEGKKITSKVINVCNEEKKLGDCMRFEVLIVVTMSMLAFWVVVGRYQHFRGTMPPS
jgi:hypothetical protein